MTEGSLQRGNDFQFRFNEQDALQYADAQLQAFEWKGQKMHPDGHNDALRIIWGIIKAWQYPEWVDSTLIGWDHRDRKNVHLCRAVSSLISEVVRDDPKATNLLALVGNLIPDLTQDDRDCSYMDMAAFVERRIRVFYEVEARLPSKYFNREHLFWEAFMMGIGFPMYMGVNRARYWEHPPKTPIFKVWYWRESQSLEFMAVCKILLQMTRYIEAQASKHCIFE